MNLSADIKLTSISSNDGQLLITVQTMMIKICFDWNQCTRVLQKVLSLSSDYFSATFYQTYFYYKLSKYSPCTETYFCNLFTQSRKAVK